MRGVLVLCVAVLAAVGVGTLAAASDTSAGARPPGLASAAPPAGYLWGELGSSAGSLVVSGSTERGNSCVSAPVDAANLRVGPVATSPCYSLRDLIPTTEVPRTLSLAVHLVLGSSPGKRLRYGPVIETLSTWGFAHAGDAVDAGGYTWIYDESRPMAVLRVSNGTRRVVERTPLPGLGYDPVLAAGIDGLYIAPGQGFSNDANDMPT